MRRTAVLLAAFVIAGCGGDDGDGGAAADEREIKAVITKALTTQDAQVKCVETVTRRFVRTIYRTLDACKAEESKPEQTEPATGAYVTEIEIDVDRATAYVRAIGGDADGARGKLAFAKEDGRWKVDELSVELLRSQLEAGMKTNRSGPFASAEVRRCFLERMAQVGDTDFRELAYDAIAGRDPHPAFLQALTSCSTSVQEGGVSVLRKTFETQLTTALLQRGTAKTVVACMLRRLRSSISDEEILALDQDDEELGRRLAAAQRACRSS